MQLYICRAAITHIMGAIAMDSCRHVTHHNEFLQACDALQ